MPMQPGNFMDGLKALVTPGLVSTACSALGESEVTVRKGLGAALSMILGALASKAEERSFMSRVFEMIKDPAAETSPLGTMAAGDVSSSSPGGRFLSALFGGKTDSIAQSLSRFAGVTQPKASSLLNLAGPLVLGYLGKTVRTSGLDPAGLSSMLLTQKNAIMRVAPNSLSSLLGIGSQIPYRIVDPAVRKPSAWRWVLPLLLILLAIAGLLWLFSGRNASALVSGTPSGGATAAFADRESKVKLRVAGNATVAASGTTQTCRQQRYIKVNQCVVAVTARLKNREIRCSPDMPTSAIHPSCAGPG